MRSQQLEEARAAAQQRVAAREAQRQALAQQGQELAAAAQQLAAAASRFTDRVERDARLRGERETLREAARVAQGELESLGRCDREAGCCWG